MRSNLTMVAAVVWLLGSCGGDDEKSDGSGAMGPGTAAAPVSLVGKMLVETVQASGGCADGNCITANAGDVITFKFVSDSVVHDGSGTPLALSGWSWSPSGGTGSVSLDYGPQGKGTHMLSFNSAGAGTYFATRQFGAGGTEETHNGNFTLTDFDNTAAMMMPAAGYTCPNAVCESAMGESADNCPQDCPLSACGEACTSDANCAAGQVCGVLSDGMKCWPQTCAACNGTCSYEPGTCAFVDCDGSMTVGEVSETCGKACASQEECGPGESCRNLSDGQKCWPTPCNDCAMTCYYNPATCSFTSCDEMPAAGAGGMGGMGGAGGVGGMGGMGP